MSEHRPIVEPDLSPARIDRQWAAVAMRLDARRRPSRWARASLLAAAAVMIAALVFWFRPPRTASLEGTAIDSAGGEQHVTLPDGTELLLSAATRLKVAGWTEKRVATVLDRGEVRFDVQHLDGRAWIVSAGAFDVRVVGTRFTVRRDVASEGEGERVEVSVERGRVEVVRRDAPGELRVLGAGESWRADAPAEHAAASALPDPPSAAPAPSSEPVPSAEPDATASASVAAAPAPPTWEELARARRFKEAYDTLGADGFASHVDRAGAEKLFQLAEVARASGHLRDAERAFDTLRHKHRGDGRAGLAAFELGRLRLDGLGNPAGAVEALGDAIAISPGAPFREDAEARRVQALERSGARAACAEARDAYLKRYPSGAHAAVVGARCPAR